MPNLDTILTEGGIRPQVVGRCARLVDEEVARKSGISGMAIKAAYGLVQKVKPTMVRDVVDKLLPEFARAIDPIYQESVAEGGEGGGAVADLFRARLDADTDRAAEALLGVTDAKIGTARPAIRKAYGKLRGGAKGHVATAVPGLARALAEFL